MTHQAHTVKIDHQFAERWKLTTMQDHAAWMERSIVAHGKHVMRAA